MLEWVGSLLEIGRVGRGLRQAGERADNSANGPASQDAAHCQCDRPAAKIDAGQSRRQHDCHENADRRADDTTREDPGGAEVLRVLDRCTLERLDNGHVRTHRGRVGRSVVQLAQGKAVDHVQNEVAHWHKWSR